MNPEIDAGMYSNRNVLCVDMKSFYASCQALSMGLDPLTTHLAVVADTNRRGSVVLAASPALKRDFGIRTGNRLFEIPHDHHITVVSAQMNMYLRISMEITRLFSKYVPKEALHTYSVDETFLQVDGMTRLWGSAENIADMILTELNDTFGLTAAVGIGPNMLMAKLCLDLEAKKYGIARWTYADIPTKLWPVSPLSQMWGIGEQLEKRLNGMGISNVGQLAHYSLPRLEKTFGIMGNQLYYHANGIDLSELGAPILQGQISYGKSQILLRDYHHISDIKYVILEMCEEVGRRARDHYQAGKTIHLGIGYSKDEGGGGFHRSMTIEKATNITMDIYQVCMHLFHRFYANRTVRKISISLANIQEDVSIQLNLFSGNRVQDRRLGYVMDGIRKKYGETSLLRAVSHTEAGTSLHRSELVGGHYAE